MHDRAVNTRDTGIATLVVAVVVATVAHAQDIFRGRGDDQQEQEQISQWCRRLSGQRFR
jgi:hypothetical protein